MSDIICSVCGEPWEGYHVHHDMPKWARALFLQGAGCEGCEGRAKSPEHALECAERAVKQQIFEPDDQEGNLYAALDQMDGAKRPEWKKPEDPVIWSCNGCDLQVKQDIDRVRPDPGEDLYLTCKGYLGYDREKANEDLIDGSEVCPLKVDGQEYCSSCANTCYECSEPTLSDDLMPHPSDPYYGRLQICRSCYEAWGTCIDCNEQLPEKDDCGSCSSCERDRERAIEARVDKLTDRIESIESNITSSRGKRTYAQLQVIAGLQAQIKRLEE